MAPAAELDPAIVDKLASLLADDASLRVPAALSGQVKEDAPQRADRVEYLRGLLTRDPGVFLERHGELLGKQDLQVFDAVRADYEVDFLVRQLQQQQEAGRQQLTPQVRNRRLAELNRLIEKGDFFSEAAMRARQPLLHHQYVGQYQPAEPMAPRQRDGHPLSSSILTDLDEAATRERFDREQEAQEAEEAESSDEEQYPEDRRAEVDQDPPRAAVHCTESAAGADRAVELRPADSAGIGAAEHVSRPLRDQAGASRSEAAGQQNGPNVGAFFDNPTVPAAGRQDLPDEDSENQPKVAPYVHIPDEERRQLADDFLQLMHHRFLAGEDEGVDYRRVDRDASLDDDWAAEQQQDAEDAYFDAVEG